MTVCLSLFVSLCWSVYLPVYVALCVCLCLSFFSSRCVYGPRYLSGIYLSLSNFLFPIYQLVSHSVSLYQSIKFYICLSIDSSVSLYFICSFVLLSIYLSICLSVCPLFIYKFFQSFHLSTFTPFTFLFFIIFFFLKRTRTVCMYKNWSTVLWGLRFLFIRVALLWEDGAVSQS